MNRDEPAFVRNNRRSEMHTRLEALIGEWAVERTIFFAVATPERPLAVAGMTIHCAWLAESGDRYLRHEVRGELGGQPYYRLGILGYSTMDERYEFNTTDSVNNNMMSYRGARGEARPDWREISLTGEFTDPGVLSDATAGQTLGQRTVISFVGPDRYVMEMYVTPPGLPEQLADRMVCTRAKAAT